MIQIEVVIFGMLRDRVVDVRVIDKQPRVEIGIDVEEQVKVDSAAEAREDVRRQRRLLTLALSGEFNGFNVRDRQTGFSHILFPALIGGSGFVPRVSDQLYRLLIDLLSAHVGEDVPGDEAEAPGDAEQGDNEHNAPEFLFHYMLSFRVFAHRAQNFL